MCHKPDNRSFNIEDRKRYENREYFTFYRMWTENFRHQLVREL